MIVCFYQYYSTPSGEGGPMPQTHLTVSGSRFLINGLPTYQETGNPAVYGLLMNARFIQGIFDDASGHERYHRFGRRFDPEAHTDALIAALPAWYRCGLRAFTVGLQGGGPCFTIPNETIRNNPFVPSNIRFACSASFPQKFFTAPEITCPRSI